MSAEAAPTVVVEGGELEGLRRPGGVRAFLGVPYAAPPVGDLRWRPPHPVVPWTAKRCAKQFGPSSLQFAPPAESLYSGGESTFSEDCLCLNIWTGSPQDTNRPVMVWLHFGAYQFGSASNPLYDGSALAAAGVTVVSVNHRLGRMGFLAHPDLSAESGHGGSGNYGLLDQIAALEWVQRNIAALGGDPANVTLFGVSAGGNSVHNLRCSPLARGLFSKVIAQSAPGFASAIDGFGHPANPSTLAAGERAGSELADQLNASGIAEMRNLPAESIIGVQLPRSAGVWCFDLIPGSAISLHVFDSGYPVIDGHVLPQPPLDAYLSGEVIDVPMIAGNAGNESSGLPYLESVDHYLDYVQNTFGEHAGEVRRLYPASTAPQARQASWDLLADQIFVWSTWTSARVQSQALTSPAWYYRFLRKPPIPTEAHVIERDYAGAFHGAEVSYVFGNLGVHQWNWTEEDRTLAVQIQQAWVDFARTGNPTASTEIDWPCLSSESGPVKIWDIEPRLDTHGPAPERMAFWDNYHGVAQHLD